jgi:hypothetical protein
MAKAAERSHRATYSTDKRNGGYIIRVEGPKANMFAGRTVPVTLKNNKGEHEEKLIRLIWSGTDKESGALVGLYAFESKPREVEDSITF